MADNGDLRILISASLNVGKSVGDINEAIKAIEKHPSLQKIKLKIDIDQNFTQTINGFINAVGKMKKISDEQNKTVSENVEIYKRLDGTVQQVTQIFLKNGEIIQRTKTVHDESKKAMLDESQAAQKLAESIDKLNKSELDSISINRDRNNRPTGYTVKSSQGYTATTQRLEPDGQTIKSSTETTNYLKQRIDALKEQKRINEQAEALDRAHFMAIRDNNKRIEDMQKLHTIALQQNLKRDEDYANRKALLQTKIADVKRRYSGDTNVVTSLSELEKSLSSISKVGYVKGFKEIELGLRRIGSEAKTSGSNTRTMGEEMGIALSRLSTWGLATTAIYGTKRALEQMIKTIIELDSQIVHLKRVMDSNTNFDQMLKGSMDIANQMGQKVTDINKALIDAAQAGYKAQEALDITKTSVIASNVSDMSPQQAMSDMIAAMKAFNIEAKDSIRIVDKLNEVDNNYSVSTRNLADSVTHAGAAAKTYGVSLDQLIGYTTAIGEVTRESGSVIGNMQKSIFSRLFTDESISALHSVNVEVIDFNGENRKASDILSDLGEKWKSLSATQQAHVGVTVAGRNQLTRFLALMNNWDTAVKATQTSLNSQGSAMRENSEYMQSMQAKINLLSTAWEHLAYTVGNNGLKGTFTGIVESLTKLTKGFTELTEATNGWNIKLPLIAASAYGVVRAVQALSLSVKGLKASLGLIGIGLVAVESIVSYFMESKKAAEINTEALVENANQTKSNADKLQELLDKHNQLKSEVDKGSGSQEELQKVLSQINDLYPQLIERTGEHGKALSLNTDETKKHIETLKRLSAEQLEQAKLANEMQRAENSTKLEEAENKLQRFGEGIKEKFNQLKLFENLFEANTIEKATKNYENKIQELAKKGQAALDSGDRESAQQIQNKIKDLQVKFIEYKEIKEKYQNEFSDYSKTVNDRNGLEQQKKVLLDWKKTIEDQIEGRISLNKSAKEGKIAADEETGAIKKRNDGLLDLAGIQRNLAGTLETTVEKARPLNDAIDKLNEGHSLTSSEISGLLKNYPDLFNAFTEENGHLKINTQALETKRDVIIKEATISIDAEQRKVDAQRTALAARLTAYSDEIKAIKSVAEAKSLESKIWQEAEDAMRKDGVAGPAFVPSQDLDALEAIGAAQETIDNIRKAAQGGFKFGNNLNSKKEKKEKQEVQLKDALEEQDLTKELIASFQGEYEARKKINEAIERRIKLSEKQKDYNKSIAETTELIKSQEQSVLDLESANQKLHQEANQVRDNHSKFNKTELSNDEFFNSWFDINDEATTAYKEFINSFAKRSQAIHDDKSLSNEKKNELIDDLKKQQKEAEDTFQHLHLLKNAYADNTVKINEMSDAIEASNERIRNFRKQATEELLKSVDVQIQKSEIAMSAYTDTSGEYRTEQEKQIGLLQTKKDIINSEREAIENRLNSGKLSVDQIKLENERLDELNVNLSELGKKQSDLRFSKISSEIKESTDKLQKYDDELKISKERMELFDEKSKEYSAELINQSKILKDKLAAEEAHEAMIRKSMEAVDLTAEAYSKLKDELRKTILAQADTIGAMKQNVLDQQKKIADDVIEIYKTMYEKQKEVRQKALEKEEEDLEKSHKQKVDMLDKEMKKYEELVQAKLKALDDQASEDDYNKQLAKMQKERDEIQKQIDIKSLNNSPEAKAALAELNKKLEEKNEEIDKFTTNRSRELQKKGLQEQLDDKKKNVDAEKEAADKTLENEKERIKKQKEYWDRYYDNLINDERRFTQIREEIMRGSTERVKQDFDGFKAFLVANNETIGQSISLNLSDKMDTVSSKLQTTSEMLRSTVGNLANEFNNNLAKALDNVIAKLREMENLSLTPKQNFESIESILNRMQQRGQQYNDTLDQNQRNFLHNENLKDSARLNDRGYQNQYDPSRGEYIDQNGRSIFDSSKSIQTYNPFGMPNEDFKKYLQNKKDYEEGKRQQDAANQNSELRKRYNISSDDYTYEELKRVSRFDTGGLTPAFGNNPKLAWLDEKELVLNKVDTSNLLKVVDITRNIIGQIKSSFDFSKLVPSPVASAGAAGNNLTIRIDNVIGDKKGAEDAAEIIYSKLRAKGWV
ncbi:phage tail tape measure protein [Paenibacillus elgii]|uniref:phage tail tape measure protein n=1 Tax=Paenibacillus elgii TaxID=189691 RepID=UPI0020404A1B|nr:phage tail tape measure protein [Paenibacillus elgii]MCM3274162.1 phage tail tape measure protein [Paenibacillus elgii]